MKKKKLYEKKESRILLRGKIKDITTSVHGRDRMIEENLEENIIIEKRKSFQVM